MGGNETASFPISAPARRRLTSGLDNGRRPWLRGAEPRMRATTAARGMGAVAVGLARRALLAGHALCRRGAGCRVFWLLAALGGEVSDGGAGCRGVRPLAALGGEVGDGSEVPRARGVGAGGQLDLRVFRVGGEDSVSRGYEVGLYEGQVAAARDRGSHDLERRLGEGAHLREEVLWRP